MKLLHYSFVSFLLLHVPQAQAIFVNLESLRLKSEEALAVLMVFEYTEGDDVTQQAVRDLVNLYEKQPPVNLFSSVDLKEPLLKALDTSFHRILATNHTGEASRYTSLRETVLWALNQILEKDPNIAPQVSVLIREVTQYSDRERLYMLEILPKLKPDERGNYSDYPTYLQFLFNGLYHGNTHVNEAAKSALKKEGSVMVGKLFEFLNQLLISETSSLIPQLMTDAREILKTMDGKDPMVNVELLKIAFPRTDVEDTKNIPFALRELAFQALGDRQVTAAIPAIQNILKTENSLPLDPKRDIALAKTALETLGSIRNQTLAADVLVDFILHAQDVRLRAFAVEQLGHHARSNDIPILLAKLHDKVDMVREAALAAFANFGRVSLTALSLQEIGQALDRLLDNPNFSKEKVLQVMGAAGYFSPRMIEIIGVGDATDVKTSKNIQITALEALVQAHTVGKIKPTESTEKFLLNIFQLYKKFGSTFIELVKALINSAGELGIKNKEFIRELYGIISSHRLYDMNIDKYVIEALGKINHPLAVHYLRRIYWQWNYDKTPKQYAFQALLNNPHPDQIWALIEILKFTPIENVWVRNKAFEALVQQQDKNYDLIGLFASFLKRVASELRINNTLYVPSSRPSFCQRALTQIQMGASHMKLSSGL